MSNETNNNEPTIVADTINTSEELRNRIWYNITKMKNIRPTDVVGTLEIVKYEYMAQVCAQAAKEA